LTFEKQPNTKFNGNIFSGSRTDSCGRTGSQTDRQTDRDMTKLRDVSRKFCEGTWKRIIFLIFLCWNFLKIFRRTYIAESVWHTSLDNSN